jgi:hypothetical protein
LLAEWGLSLGLEAAPDALERHAGRLPTDLPHGLREHWARALAIEELLLSRPALVSAHAPTPDEGRRLSACLGRRTIPTVAAIRRS